MFTGIVTGVGRVARVEKKGRGLRLKVAAPRGYGRFTPGESVSVSGVCLTAVEGGKALVADVSEETARVTNLGRLAPGEAVNLEKSLRWGDSVSGHFVLGHVDGVTRLLSIAPAGRSWTYRFALPRGLARYVVRKGSVALDGVSLTVSARRASDFDVAIIPETRRRTTLSSSRPGDLVNFEADVFARYGKRGANARVSRSRP